MFSLPKNLELCHQRGKIFSKINNKCISHTSYICGLRYYPSDILRNYYYGRHTTEQFTNTESVIHKYYFFFETLIILLKYCIMLRTIH
jgi:hypothetical protein